MQGRELDPSRRVGLREVIEGAELSQLSKRFSSKHEHARGLPSDVGCSARLVRTGRAGADALPFASGAERGVCSLARAQGDLRSRLCRQAGGRRHRCEPTIGQRWGGPAAAGHRLLGCPAHLHPSQNLLAPAGHGGWGSTRTGETLLGCLNSCEGSTGPSVQKADGPYSLDSRFHSFCCSSASKKQH